MPTPYLSIDLDKIEHNARSIVSLCRRHGIDVSGVTKGVCGDPRVARAMLRGGVGSIADSRLDNIRRMRAAGIDAPFMLLRLPSLSAAREVIDSVESSLNSEPAVLAALSQAAIDRQRRHDVVLMVDVGDLREGVWPDDLPALARKAHDLRGIRIHGIGTNLGCFGGVVPDADNMRYLVELAGAIEQDLGLTLDCISGINSSGLELIAAGRMPARVNHARIGEAILLGRETTRRKAWPDTFQDAFVLHAEVLAVGRKPSLPLGQRGENAFGEFARLEDHGTTRRALLNLGRADVLAEALAPRDAGLEILGASSDYLVVDVDSAQKPVKVGDELTFDPAYGALLAAMNSAYIDRRFLRDGVRVERPT